MTEELDQVHQVLTRIPGFEKLQPDSYQVERLGGLTNLVFRIDSGADRYVLRIPGKGTEEYIDRKVEMHNARVAAYAGVSAEVLHADSDNGVLLMRHLDNTVTIIRKGEKISLFM